LLTAICDSCNSLNAYCSFGRIPKLNLIEGLINWIARDDDSTTIEILRYQRKSHSLIYTFESRISSLYSVHSNRQCPDCDFCCVRFDRSCGDHFYN